MGVEWIVQGMQPPLQQDPAAPTAPLPASHSGRPPCASQKRSPLRVGCACQLKGWMKGGWLAGCLPASPLSGSSMPSLISQLHIHQPARQTPASGDQAGRARTHVW